MSKMDVIHTLSLLSGAASSVMGFMYMYDNFPNGLFFTLGGAMILVNLWSFGEDLFGDDDEET